LLPGNLSSLATCGGNLWRHLYTGPKGPYRCRQMQPRLRFPPLGGGFCHNRAAMPPILWQNYAAQWRKCVWRQRLTGGINAAINRPPHTATYGCGSATTPSCWRHYKSRHKPTVCLPTCWQGGFYFRRRQDGGAEYAARHVPLISGTMRAAYGPNSPVYRGIRTRPCGGGRITYGNTSCGGILTPGGSTLLAARELGRRHKMSAAAAFAQQCCRADIRRHTLGLLAAVYSRLWREYPPPRDQVAASVRPFWGAL